MSLVTRVRAALAIACVALTALVVPAAAGAVEAKYAETIKPLTEGTEKGFIEVVPPVLAVIAVLLVIALIVNFARKHLKKA